MASVTQYFGIFRGDWKSRFRKDTPLDLLTRLNISFGKIISVGNHHFSVDFDGPSRHVSALMKRVKKINPNAEVFLTVGGNGGNQSYGGASKDPLFAENVANFLLMNGFNGFDVDWELSLYKDGLNSLTTNLSSELKPKGLSLTLDGWPYGSSAYDLGHLKGTLDQINVMSYGTSVSLETCVDKYASKGFPVNQLIGGIETEIDYIGGTDTLGPDGTIAQKASIARTLGLAGMMSWRMDNDYADQPNHPTYRGAVQLWQSMHAI